MRQLVQFISKCCCGNRGLGTLNLRYHFPFLFKISGKSSTCHDLIRFSTEDRPFGAFKPQKGSHKFHNAAEKALVHDIPVFPSTGFETKYGRLNDSRHSLIAFNIYWSKFNDKISWNSYIPKKNYKKVYKIQYEFNRLDLAFDISSIQNIAY